MLFGGGASVGRPLHDEAGSDGSAAMAGDRTREMRRFAAEQCNQRPFASDCTRGAPSPGLLAQEKKVFGILRICAYTYRAPVTVEGFHVDPTLRRPSG
jgi:hypothetical protein